MKATRISIMLLAAALGAGVDLELQAQEDQIFSPFVRSLTRPLQKRSGNGTEQPGTGNRDQQVGRNIDRFWREAAMLSAQGMTAAEIHAALSPRQTLAATGSITGTLYESDGVTPVSSYTSVYAYNEFGLYCGYGSVISSSNGVYRIQNLATGNYYVRLGTSVDQYISVYYNGALDWENATLVPVVNGQATTGIDFVLRYYQGAISGTVLDAQGAPLADVGVAVYDLQQNELNFSSTDLSGHYTVSGLPTGDVKVKCGLWRSGNYIPQWFDKAASFDAAAIVHVVEPETTKGKDFSLERGGVISGEIVMQGEDTIQRGATSIDVDDAEGNLVMITTNDPAGRFYIDGLATGTYVVSYRYNGTGNYVDGWYDGVSDRALATPVQVTAPETTVISLLLQRGGYIAGTISYMSLQGIVVSAYNEGKQEVEEGMTDANGRFVISRLPGGRYRILASTVQSYSYQGVHAIDQWYNNAGDFSKAEFVDVHPADTSMGIDFTLSPGGSISGSVIGPNGVPVVSGGNVYACDVRGATVQSGRSGSGGAYTIGGLPTGQYKVVIAYGGKENYASEWYNGRSSSHAATVVTVTAPGAVAHVDFTLEYGGLFGGYLKDDAGNRLSSDHREINIVLYEADSAWYVASSWNSFVGGYQGRFLPRNYRLGFFEAQYNFQQPQDSLAVVYYGQGKSFADAGTTVIPVVADSYVKLNDCIMGRTAGGISGVIHHRGTGGPLTTGGYLVMAFDEWGCPAKSSAYNPEYAPISGEYQMRGLWPGRYYLLAVAFPQNGGQVFAQWFNGVDGDADSVLNVPMPEVPPGAIPVTVGAGMTPGIDFYVGPSVGISPTSTPALPLTYGLRQNYPNPFNPSTTIRYELPVSQDVRLIVFDVLGREVSVLVDGRRDAGVHDVKFNATGLSSGVYFYRLQARPTGDGQAGDYVATKKLLLLR